MWSYYGSKTNLVDYYPAPKFDKIREDFAGSARYSLKYFDRDVTLVDQYEVVVRIWKFLQACKPADILALPRRMSAGQSLDEFKFDCEEAKLLMGFLVAGGRQSPGVKAGYRKTDDRPNFINYSLKRIAGNLYKIRHWKIIHGSYLDAPDEEATWFVDPPYQFGGHVYVKSNKHIDFPALGAWCRQRKGQVIVCENNMANWLPFVPLASTKGTKKTMQKEVVWTSEPTALNNIQLQLFDPLCLAV